MKYFNQVSLTKDTASPRFRILAKIQGLPLHYRQNTRMYTRLSIAHRKVGCLEIDSEKVLAPIYL
jgi:hypothetical protein